MLSDFGCSGEDVLISIEVWILVGAVHTGDGGSQIRAGEEDQGSPHSVRFGFVFTHSDTVSLFKNLNERLIYQEQNKKLVPL